MRLFAEIQNEGRISRDCDDSVVEFPIFHKPAVARDEVAPVRSFRLSYAWKSVLMDDS